MCGFQEEDAIGSTVSLAAEQLSPLFHTIDHAAVRRVENETAAAAMLASATQLVAALAEVNVGIDGDGVSHGADLADNAADDDVSVTVEDVDDEVVQQRVDRALEAGCSDGLVDVSFAHATITAHTIELYSESVHVCDLVFGQIFETKTQVGRKLVYAVCGANAAELGDRGGRGNAFGWCDSVANIDARCWWRYHRQWACAKPAGSHSACEKASDDGC